MKRPEIRRFVCMLLIMGGSVLQVLGSSSTDHLLPLRQLKGSGIKYDHLWKQKLLITPGDTARFVALPGISGEEQAVSVYQMPGRRNPFGSDYWLTVTQATGRLADTIFTPGEKSSDLRRIKIERCDIALPETTARAVSNTWLPMLHQVRVESTSGAILLDSSTEIFFAKTNSGKLLAGQLPPRTSKRTSALLDIANSLIELCNVSEARRPEKFRNIEKKCGDLLNLIKSSDSKR
jgi:hypothetical protein